ncbi:MAG: cadherin-like domain-containing protein [Hyphomicrobium sp.]
MGGQLTAELRNIPPSISGDLDLAVDKGRAVRITLQDLSALDPDDTASHLTFTVSQVRNGFVALASDPVHPVDTFTQADLEQGDGDVPPRRHRRAARQLRRYRGRSRWRNLRHCPDGERRGKTALTAHARPSALQSPDRPNRLRRATFACSSATRSLPVRLAPARLM